MKISDEAVGRALEAWLDPESRSQSDGMRAALTAAVPYLMPDREALAMALQKHHPTTGMAVASGVTCQCGYWNGNERPGVDRPAGAQGRDGLDWHRAQVVLSLLRSEVPSDQPS